MGYLRFRRSIRLAPGIKLNLGKRGISASVGVRGAHETFHISGRTTTSVGIPGTGISYIRRSSVGTRPRRAAASSPTTYCSTRTAARPARAALTGPALAAALATPGFLASQAEKRYHAGVVAYLAGNQVAALALFEQVCADDSQVASAHLLAAVCAIGTGDHPRAIQHLEAVVQAPVALPDRLAARYLPAQHVNISMQVAVTPLVLAQVPFNRAGAVLALAEQYQLADRLEEAVGLLQQLHQGEPDDPVVRLSMADVLFAEGDFEGVVEVAAPAQNVDDVNLATIHLRAKALLELDDRVAGFETYRSALARQAGRSPELLKAIRYDRALAYEQTGQSAKARADFERLFALDPAYQDVKARLASSAPPSTGELMRPEIWIPEEAPPAERQRLAESAEVHIYSASGAVPASLGRGDLIVGGTNPRRALEVAPHIEGLRYFQTFSAGVDRIVGRLPDGVTLCDAAGVHDIAVAEWVVMVILAAERRLPEHVLGQRAGTWRRERLTGNDLDGATVAMVGVGAIGRAVEARLLPFGVRIVRVARRARDGVRAVGELKATLAGADIVVILIPLTAETTGLFDAPTIAAMRPGALLVNASRGRIVDTDAMTAAVLEGRIRVALDVTDPEPLPDGHRLWSAPGALITPHVASDVRDEDARAWQLIEDQVGRLARGEPPINEVVDGY